jgi:hypothetical protein
MKEQLTKTWKDLFMAHKKQMKKLQKKEDPEAEVQKKPTAESDRNRAKARD